ncbi:WD repeat-containing protein 54-like isoform X4 [Hemitrygon akajei]|uniref:WD repeat-containing protein 54-like isoform X4 n=1 Tax=Hemitrygon akajei TaxID=2704970 RepID=UPI003BFA01B3
MYKKEKGIQIKSSASALYNNLSVLPITHKNPYFAVIHGGLVNMASWCVLPSRILLVLASQKGIQMYESDGSIMVYWHAMDTPEAQTDAVFARGIAATRSNYICVGTPTVQHHDICGRGLPAADPLSKCRTSDNALLVIKMTKYLNTVTLENGCN